MKPLPDWLLDRLRHPPQAGDGLHAWLFSTARQLHAHMPAEAIEAALAAAVSGSERPVPDREIRDAVRNSEPVAWRPREGSDRGRGTAVPPVTPGAVCVSASPPVSSSRWPSCDKNTRALRIGEQWHEGVACLADLWERSPVHPDGLKPDDWIDWLMPDAEWVCLAVDHPATARTRPPWKWSFGPADASGLIVPSPMTAPSGMEKGGCHRSHRCLDNTGPRRWLVIEFDSGTLDEQAALHWHLGRSADALGWPRLRLVVHSGGKSLHGWFGPIEAGTEIEAADETVRSLMEYAMSLGADPATWNRCQLVRLPGGRRGKRVAREVELPDDWTDPDEIRQHVVFWDPDLWKTGRNPSSRSSAPPGSTPDRTLAMAH